MGIIYSTICCRETKLAESSQQWVAEVQLYLSLWMRGWERFFVSWVEVEWGQTRPTVRVALSKPHRPTSWQYWANSAVLPSLLFPPKSACDSHLLVTEEISDFTWELKRFCTSVDSVAPTTVLLSLAHSWHLSVASKHLAGVTATHNCGRVALRACWNCSCRQLDSHLTTV